VERYTPDRYVLDLSLISLVPMDVAQRYRAVPLQKTGSYLTVAMTDPSELPDLDALENIVQMEVDPVLCTRPEFEQLLGSLYGKSVTLDGGVENLDELQYEQAEEQDGFEIQMGSLLDLGNEAPVIRLVNWIIARAVADRASDVHLSPEKNAVRLRYRIDGVLKDQPAPPKSMFANLVSRIKILAKLDISTSRTPQDGRLALRIDGREINVRVSTIPTVNGENVVLRILDTSAGVISLEKMGMDAAGLAKVEAAIRKPYGMILTTGPTGSGKTTSLYSIINQLNRPEVNIMTIEDPVEYRMDRVRQVQLNEKAGMTFASGLRSILRQDPDVVMVGEIRDTETARIAVQAALTGHIVLATVHTNNAAGAVTRLVDMGIEPLLVSSVLLMTIAQRLVRLVCPACAVEYVARPEALAYWNFPEGFSGKVKKAVGCPSCSHQGYRGRTGVFEILEINEKIKDMIMTRSPDHEITRVARETNGFVTLQEAAAEKIAAGVLTIEEAMLKVGM
jgi:type IV pilus assembly protein PilB